MPLYLYKCPACSRSRDVLKPLSQLDREERCEACETAMDRKLCAPSIVTDYAGYSCPVTGKWIEGRRAHEENLKRQGCRVLETGETDQVRRSARKAEETFDREVDATVDQFYETLPTAEREQLAVAVQSGLDVSVDRK